MQLKILGSFYAFTSLTYTYQDFYIYLKYSVFFCAALNSTVTYLLISLPQVEISGTLWYRTKNSCPTSSERPKFLEESLRK